VGPWNGGLKPSLLHVLLRCQKGILTPSSEILNTMNKKKIARHENWWSSTLLESAQFDNQLAVLIFGSNWWFTAPKWVIDP
jgi:hypothetical protein